MEPFAAPPPASDDEVDRGRIPVSAVKGVMDSLEFARGAARKSRRRGSSSSDVSSEDETLSQAKENRRKRARKSLEGYLRRHHESYDK